jgi:hypothetical protein
MIEEPRTVKEFVEALIAERGGRDRFSAVQVRLCHTIAWGLRDPSKVDPSTVSRLIDLLPPRVMPPEAKAAIPAIVLVDGLAHALEASGLDESDAVQLMRDRIAELEREIVVLKQAAIKPPVSENIAPTATVVAARAIPEGRANVVPLHRDVPHDPSFDASNRGNGSCAINMPLEQRYPLSHLDPVGRW